MLRITPGSGVFSRHGWRSPAGKRVETVGAVPLSFAGVLRGLRIEAGLTQEELAEAAGLTSRAISYLERGEVATPRKETVRLLADALRLTGPARTQFETVARVRGAAVTDGAAATRTLPRDVAAFTGRYRELAELVDAAAGASTVVSICAIGGMAGTGKTALAVHAAHRLAALFPGGQIFLSLHGHTHGQQPADPADALASLLATIGVPAAQIPASLEARTALWRDRAAQRRLLLILDDAISSEQVAPLLPGTGGGLVLITSRRHLSALDGARPVSLDSLPPDEAAALLARLSGRSGLTPQDGAVTELVGLCGCLPLAIGMVARQLLHHPAWTASGRAAQLAAAADRLEVLTTENLSVAATFDLSYADLTGDQQRLFRRLGLHPGNDIDGYAAAALDGTSLADARRGLEDLYDQYLLVETTTGRYRLHDLLREHARALASRLDTDHEREQATARLLDYYQHTISRANALTARQTRPAAAAAAAGQAAPTGAPDLAEPEDALAWARAERASLLACVDHATAAGDHVRVVSLTAGLSGLLQRDGPWTEAISRHTVAIAAAQDLGDRLGEASALNDLGILRRLTDDYAGAARSHQEALRICSEHGDQLGEASARTELGAALQMSGDYPAAAAALEHALSIYRQIGSRLGEANALSRLGDMRQHTGDFPAAAAALEHALGIYRQIGNRLGQANALNRLGDVRQHTGDYPAAAQAQDQALGMYRDLGDRLGEANALNGLGDVHRQTGDYPAAAHAYEEALGIYRQIGYRLNEATALGSLGVVLRLTRDYPAAASALEQALGIYGQIGSRLGETAALNELGALHLDSGELARAEACHRHALELARAIDDSWDEAHALAGLGHCAVAAGRTKEAGAQLGQALEIFQRIGSAEAGELSAELDVLSRHDRATSNPHPQATGEPSQL